MSIFGPKKTSVTNTFAMKAPTDLTQALSTGSQIVIKQKRELVEVFLGFETRNQYLVFDHNGAPCGTIVERGSGFMAFLKRVFLKSHRPFVIDIIDANGKAILELKRPFFFFFSDITVKVPDGPILGSAHRRFGILYKNYDLRTPEGQTFARIRSALFKIWTFAIRDSENIEVARVSKKWSGALKEIFTDSDNFIIEFGEKHWGSQNRAVILAAAISIDFDFFENNGNN